MCALITRYVANSIALLALSIFLTACPVMFDSPPDVVGMYEDAAVERLKDDGWKVTTSYAASIEFDLDIVISQKPRAQDWIILINVVHLVVSLGPGPAEGETEGEGEGESEYETETVMLPGAVPLLLVHIPAGQFMMGHYQNEQDYFDDEVYQHEVTLTQDFWLGQFEVTQGQWEAIMGTTPWAGQVRIQEDANNPAAYITWDDAQAFVTELSNLTGATYRLPTEAEWEFACRAGTATRFYWGDDPNYEDIGYYACYTANAWDIGEHYAHRVGLRQPNGLGLFDMSGNVFEWCFDWMDFYPPDPAVDPTGPSTGSYRVQRGGSWFSAGRNCRSAARNSDFPDSTSAYVGFRVAR